MSSTYHDLAREHGASRRHAAQEASLASVIRLANREARLQRRIARLSGQVHSALR